MGLGCKSIIFIWRRTWRRNCQRKSWNSPNKQHGHMFQVCQLVLPLPLCPSCKPCMSCPPTLLQHIAHPLRERGKKINSNNPKLDLLIYFYFFCLKTTFVSYFRFDSFWSLYLLLLIISVLYTSKMSVLVLYFLKEIIGPFIFIFIWHDTSRTKFLEI